MGNLLRQFWLPVVPTADAPKAGGRPYRMQLLGEELVLFRSTKGEIGLLFEFCPHRGVSLYFGRNEDGGLRCVYHGWMYAPDGQCMDMPNEPVAANFKNKVRQLAYPTKEINGTIWTYMGPRSEPPPFPDFGLASVPEDQKGIRLTVRECNWMQALEGDLDLSHGAYLHSALRGQFLNQNHLDRYAQETPHFEALETEYGITHSVRRKYDDEHDHWGVGHFIFPFYAQFPPVGDQMEVVPGHLWIPMNDHSTLVWSYQWRPTGPLSDAPRRATLGAQGSTTTFSSNQAPALYDNEWDEYAEPTPLAGSQWLQKANFMNDFGFNESAQGDIRYSGLPTVELQDRGIQESMRKVVDRTIEHLGTTDAAQIRVRHRLIQAAKALRDHGVVPECVDKPEAFRVRSGSGVLPKGASWIEDTREWTQDAIGKPVNSKGHLPLEEVKKLADKIKS
jgi:phenylpropionate dioxygenase-like ring-hydroxylating dioxygenase large terminal subunit